jgi:hypothetical protein
MHLLSLEISFSRKGEGHQPLAVAGVKFSSSQKSSIINSLGRFVIAGATQLKIAISIYSVRIYAVGCFHGTESPMKTTKTLEKSFQELNSYQ